MLPYSFWSTRGVKKRVGQIAKFALVRVRRLADNCAESVTSQLTADFSLARLAVVVTLSLSPLRPGCLLPER